VVFYLGSFDNPFDLCNTGFQRLICRQWTSTTSRLRGNWDQEMAKWGATTHLPMVPRNCILFEIARAQRGRIVISAPNSLQLLCSQRRVPFFLDLVP